MLPDVTIVVAYDMNRGIGFEGAIPWRIKEEMAHFKATTTGHAVIMGRKTWESLPDRFRPLPERLNIVVSGSISFDMLEADCMSVYKADKTYQYGTHFCRFMGDALSIAREWCPDKEIFIIGGSQIYSSYLNKGWVTRILASEILETHPADAYFPRLPVGWTGKELSTHERFRVVEYRLEAQCSE